MMSAFKMICGARTSMMSAFTMIYRARTSMMSAFTMICRARTSMMLVVKTKTYTKTVCFGIIKGNICRKMRAREMGKTANSSI
eukprot:4204749-Amphidinium_carterae.1